MVSGKSESDSKSKLFTVTVISGKGGVGKTSITSSLAFMLAKQNHSIIVADADVDAANLAILFRPLENNAFDQNKTVRTVQTTEKAEFLPEKCIHCKQCIDQNFCSFDALSWDEQNKIPIVDTIACEGCRACHLLCPTHAFKIAPVNSGTITSFQTDYDFPLISGETILGSQTSGKMVTELRKVAESRAQEEKRKLLLMDGPPGIGCPVLAAVTGVDFVILVTEPTTAALHDVKRAISIVSSFNIPFGIIINKRDMNPEMYNKMTEYFNQKGWEILGSFPLNERWPYAIVNQQPIVKLLEDDKISHEFEKISQKLWQKQLDLIS